MNQLLYSPPIEPTIYQLEEKFKPKGSFKDNCITYIEYPEERLNISAMFPIIEKAFNILGAEKIRALGYHSPKIEAALRANSTEIVNVIKLELQSKLELNKEYLASEIKDLFNSIYKSLNLEKKAKATDIDNYFEVDRRQKRFKGILKNIVVLLKDKGK